MYVLAFPESRVISRESLVVRNQEGGVKVKVIQFFQILSGSIRVRDERTRWVPTSNRPSGRSLTTRDGEDAELQDESRIRSWRKVS
jgi:hypothetical protein